MRKNLAVIDLAAPWDNGARPFIPTQEMTEVHKRLHGIKSCLFKAMIDVFIAPHLQSFGRLNVECDRKKGAHDVFVQAQVEDTSKPKVEYGKKQGVVVTEIGTSYHGQEGLDCQSK